MKHLVSNENEKYLFSNTQEFYTGGEHGLNRHQRFIHSVGGFKKPIYRYTNQAKEKFIIMHIMKWCCRRIMPFIIFKWTLIS